LARGDAEIWDIFYHRRQALICRALAGSCLHRGTREALLAMAAEHDAKSDRLEAQARRAGGDADREPSP